MGLSRRTPMGVPQPKRSHRHQRLIAALGCLLSVAVRTGAFAAPTDSERATRDACEQAGIAAEQANGLPAGLLLAIGRVESGRWDAERGRVMAWPWAINAAGRGQWFDSKDAAAQTVKALLDGGTKSIDVGCFQINLMYHPQAFATLEQGFDPESNARYAARFLLSLYARTGTWDAAVEAYHSADPVLGFAYRQQVFASWGPVTAGSIAPLRAGPVMAAAPRAKPLPIPMIIAGVAIWTPMPAGTAPKIVAMPGTPATVVPPDTAVAEMAASLPALPVVTYRVMPRK
jgi:hypothetical protein